jgi:hypothetical protein
MMVASPGNSQSHLFLHLEYADSVSALLRELRSALSVLALITLTLSLHTALMSQVWLVMHAEDMTSARFHYLVPMEEIVRAFNWVIEKGWVRRLRARVIGTY